MQQQKPQPSLLQALDAGLVVQLQALTAQLTAAAAANTLNPLEQGVSFNKVEVDLPPLGEGRIYKFFPWILFPVFYVTHQNFCLFNFLNFLSNVIKRLVILIASCCFVVINNSIFRNPSYPWWICPPPRIWKLQLKGNHRLTVAPSTPVASFEGSFNILEEKRR